MINFVGKNLLIVNQRNVNVTSSSGGNGRYREHEVYNDDDSHGSDDRQSGR